MKGKTMKKITALFLILLMIVVPFVSCADASGDGQETGNINEGTDLSEGTVGGSDTAVNDEVLEVPDERFEGEEFVILTPDIVT